jgi:hypothetical protein
MNTYNNFLAIFGRDLRAYGNTIPFYIGYFSSWFDKLNKAFAFTNAKQVIEASGIKAKLQTLEEIIYIKGSPFASNQTYEMYQRIAGTNGAESAFKPYRADIEGYFNTLTMQLAPFEATAKSNIAEISAKVEAFEARKANMDSVIGMAIGTEEYNKANQEKQAYYSIQELLGDGKASIELYAWAMYQTYLFFNPMNVQITSTQTVEIAKSEASPEEMVAVATVAKDSSNQVVTAEQLPKTQTGEIATTKAIDEATGNVVEIVTDKQNLPITKTAVVENSSTGHQLVQNLAVNAQGQPVAAVVTDSTGAPKTMTDPVSKQEMPVVNTATVPQAIMQAVNSPHSVARVESDGTPVATATNTPQENRKPNLTKAGVILGVCAVLAVVGYSILK